MIRCWSKVKENAIKMAQEDNKWLQEFFDDLEEQVSSVARFKTKKARREFFGGIKNDLQNLLVKHMVNRVDASTWKQNAFTRPMGDGYQPNGHAVMTEGMSQLGDSVLGVGPASNQTEALKPSDKNRTADRKGVNVNIR